MMVNEVKAHIIRHKRVYLVGSYVLVAGITYVIVRGNLAQWGRSAGLNAQGGLTNTASFSLARQTNKLITVIKRDGSGHPGWPVQNLETKHVFLSQREAAKAMKISEELLSGHLNGKFPDVDGLHFERVSLAPLRAVAAKT